MHIASQPGGLLIKAARVQEMPCAPTARLDGLAGRVHERLGDPPPACRASSAASASWKRAESSASNSSSTAPNSSRRDEKSGTPPDG